MVALSFCRLLGLGCPKQAFAKIATPRYVLTLSTSLCRSLSVCSSTPGHGRLHIPSMNMHIALREGDDNALFGEPAMDFSVHVGHHRQPVRERTNVDTKAEIQAAVSELVERYSRLWLIKHALIFIRQLKQDLHRPVNVAAVGDTHLDQDPSGLIRQGPIQEPSGDQLFVRDQELFQLEVTDGRGPDADAHYLARGITDRNEIADPNRPFEQDDQTADEVCHDLLQTEADPNAQGRYQPLQLGPLTANSIDCEETADKYDGVVGQSGESVFKGSASLKHVKYNS